MRKTLLALTLALALVLSFAALAATAQYPTAQAFTNLLDATGVAYEYAGVDAAGSEIITIGNTDGNGLVYTIRCLFDREGKYCLLEAPGLYAVSEENLAEALRLCNEANISGRFVRFALDPETDAVSAFLDVLLYEEGDCAPLCLGGVIKLASATEAAYASFSPLGGNQ